MRKLLAALSSSLLVVTLLFGCTSDQSAENKGSCASDAQCALGLHCTPDHSCRQCAFDTQCPDSERCAQGSCSSRVSCSTNQDCKGSASPICDAALKECVGCAGNGDCVAPLRCLQHACEAVAACASGADCEPGQACQLGRCVPSCQADADCAGGGLVCDFASHTCTQCLINADCPSAFHCAAGSCERDPCTAGENRCTSDGQGVELCAPAGDRFLTLFCASSQSCHNDSGKASCSGWLCTPGTGGCSSDARRVETCTADGQSIQVDHECAANQICSVGVCVNVVCTPGLSYCQAGSVRRCSEDGTLSTLIQECTGDTHCDDDSAQCAKNECVAGKETCQGNQVTRCKADGSGYETETECGKSSACIDGACRTLLCEPNSTSCDAQGRVQQCNAQGTGSAVINTCDAGQRCVQSSTGASCAIGGCVPSQTSCNGDVVVKCKADGSELEALTTDCAATNQVCYAGACSTKLCTPNTLSCVQGSVALCVKNGSATQPFDTCTSSEYCDAASPGCKAQVCTPNTLGCNGNVAATCNADGSGYLSASAVDCAPSGKLCVSGACQTPICTPNAFLCQSGDVYRCNAQGTATVLDTNCNDSSQHCVQAGNVSYCASDACTAGSVTCNGNVATKCLADGSGYEVGTDCGAQVCVSGACQPKTCVPGSLTCSGGNSSVCNSTGTAYTLKQTCTANQFCSGSSGLCLPDVCPAGAQGCVGEVLGVCNNDGSGLLSSTTDCNASHQVCTLSGCVPTVIDSISTSGVNFSGHSTLLTMYGEFVYASSARRLTAMQQSLLAYNTTPLRWIVYQSDNAFGPYRPIYDQIAPIIPQTFTVQSSGPLDVPLLSGKFYYFATVAAPSATFSSETATTQRYISFGHVLGTYTGTFSSTPTESFSITAFNSNFAPMTLSTTVP